MKGREDEGKVGVSNESKYGSPRASYQGMGRYGRQLRVKLHPAKPNKMHQVQVKMPYSSGGSQRLR